MGAIIVLKRVFAVVVEMKGRIHDCTPMRCDIFLLMQSTCFFQFREGSNQRPRYLKQLTCSKDSPLMLSLSPPLPFRQMLLSTKEHCFSFVCVQSQSIHIEPLADGF